MIKFQLLFSVLAVGGLFWRMIDPSGSYDAVFQLAENLAGFLPGGFVVARAVGLFVADQFVGFLFGMGFVSSLYLILLGARFSMSVFLRRKRVRTGP
ncbi:MAG: hypothetical protein AAFR75_00890 [Pseudomonadota bacterium]